MLKYLLVVGVIAFVYFFFIKKKPMRNSSGDTKLEASDMVECPTCGTYCEVGESILSGGKYYCSQECLKGA